VVKSPISNRGKVATPVSKLKSPSTESRKSTSRNIVEMSLTPLRTPKDQYVSISELLGKGFMDNVFDAESDSEAEMGKEEAGEEGEVEDVEKKSVGLGAMEVDVNEEMTKDPFIDTGPPKEEMPLFGIKTFTPSKGVKRKEPDKDAEEEEGNV
jgi:hypothetical protein